MECEVCDDGCAPAVGRALSTDEILTIGTVSHRPPPVPRGPAAPHGRRHLVRRSCVGALCLVLTALAAGIWWYSPWERLSGPYGAVPRPLSAMPVSYATRQAFAADPVLVAGAVVERHDGGVRAVNVGTGATWWGISRPGRVSAAAVGRIDDRRVAIAWSDHRLTIVDVPTGHRTDVAVPDRSDDRPVAGADYGARLVAVTDRLGRRLAVVVQPRGVDAYDAASGRRAWSANAPAGCGYSAAIDAYQQVAGFVSLMVACPGGEPEHVPDSSAGTLLDASSGRSLPGFAHLAVGELLPVGAHEVLADSLGGTTGYEVFDTRTGRRLWRLGVAAPNAAYAPGGTVTGGDGLVLAEDGSRRLTAFRAADGTPLWHWQAPDNGGPASSLLSAAVVGGAPRVLLDQDGVVEVVTFTAGGRPVGMLRLTEVGPGDVPVLYGGADGTLLVADEDALVDHRRPGPYVYLAGTR